MKRRILFALAALVLAGLAVVKVTAQQPATPPLDITSPPLLSDQPVVRRGDKMLVTETKPEEMTAEQLLEKVKAIRAQKAELEKQEQALMKVLRKKDDALKAEVDLLSGKGQPPLTESIPAPPVPGGAPPLPGLPAPGKQCVGKRTGWGLAAR